MLNCILPVKSGSMVLLRQLNIILLLRILTESNNFFQFFFINISPPISSNKSSFYEDCYEYCTTYMYIIKNFFPLVPALRPRIFQSNDQEPNLIFKLFLIGKQFTKMLSSKELAVSMQRSRKDSGAGAAVQSDASVRVVCIAYSSLLIPTII